MSKYVKLNIVSTTILRLKTYKDSKSICRCHLTANLFVVALFSCNIFTQFVTELFNDILGWKSCSKTNFFLKMRPLKWNLCTLIAQRHGKTETHKATSRHWLYFMLLLLLARMHVSLIPKLSPYFHNRLSLVSLSLSVLLLSNEWIPMTPFLTSCKPMILCYSAKLWVRLQVYLPEFLLAAVKRKTRELKEAMHCHITSSTKVQ